MEKKLNIYSCQQDWNKMPETENGRLCERCNHCLVDFRDMDLEAIQDFRRKAKKDMICGVYLPDQVATTIPIHQAPRKKKKKWWALAASLAAVFASNAAIMPPPTVHTHQIYIANQEAITNTPCCTLSGKILDKYTSEPLSGVSILVDRQPLGTSNFDGKFEVEIFDPAFRENGNVELQFIYPGYEIVINQVSNETLTDYLNIRMVQEAPEILPERPLMGIMIYQPEPVKKESGIKKLFKRKK